MVFDESDERFSSIEVFGEGDERGRFLDDDFIWTSVWHSVNVVYGYDG